MEKELFKSISNELQKHIDDCKERFKRVDVINKIEELTIKEYKELKEFTERELPYQTNFLMVDFYHIIAMGNLTVLQTNTLIKQTKEYSSYRPYFKVLESGELTYIGPFTISKYNRKYNLMCFDGQLGCQDENAKEIKETVRDYEISKDLKKEEVTDTIKDVPYEYYDQENGIMKLKTANIEPFVNYFIDNYRASKNRELEIRTFDKQIWIKKFQTNKQFNFYGWHWELVDGVMFQGIAIKPECKRDGKASFPSKK